MGGLLDLLVVDLIGLAADQLMADLSQDADDLLMVGGGDGQSPLGLLGERHLEEPQIMGRDLEAIADHGGDNLSQKLGLGGLGGGALTHIDLAGDLMHRHAVAHSLDNVGGLPMVIGAAQIQGGGCGHEHVELLGLIDPVLSGADALGMAGLAAVTVEPDQIDGLGGVCDAQSGELGAIGLGLVLMDLDGVEGQQGDGGDDGILGLSTGGETLIPGGVDMITDDIVQLLTGLDGIGKLLVLPFVIPPLSQSFGFRAKLSQGFLCHSKISPHVKNLIPN